MATMFLWLRTYLSPTHSISGIYVHFHVYHGFKKQWHGSLFSSSTFYLFLYGCKLSILKCLSHVDQCISCFKNFVSHFFLFPLQSFSIIFSCVDYLLPKNSVFLPYCVITFNKFMCEVYN